MITTKNVITYKNTKTNLPGLEQTVHEANPRGYAYLQADYFIHIYGYGDPHPFWTLSTGLTASQANKITNGDINQWAINTFGAEDIKVSKNTIGEAVFGVWRPGLYHEQEIFLALSTNEYEKRSVEQALRILIEKMDDLFLYIEPSQDGLKSYSHKTRELLILACTELENIFKQYMFAVKQTPTYREFSTADYVKLKKPLFLEEYEVILKPYKNIEPIRPFANWNSLNPTQSLEWYNAYNKTKHDRHLHFDKATLFNCIHSVVANIIL